MEGKLRSFLQLVERLKKGDDQQDGFSEEFSEIKSQAATFRHSTLFSTEAGGNKDNLKKNRYKDILPYDQTRVPLSLLVNEGYSDYINANFIKGISNERDYIATQGPLNKTVLDFWRMIWQYEVKVIIMACREVEMGKKKCECYWASEGETSEFGPFSVTNVEEEKWNTEVIIRTLEATFQNERRTVYHYQYMAWPDHGIPDSCDCILDMIDSVRKRQGQNNAPICIHCSAGCGRTGVICTVDYVRQLLLTERLPDDFSIFDIVLEMRRQRPSVVQTKEQYKFVYHTVAEMFWREIRKLKCDYENVPEVLPEVLLQKESTERPDKLYNDVNSQNWNSTQLLPRIPQRIPRSFHGTVEDGTEKTPERPRSKTSAPMNDTYAVVRKPKARLHLDNFAAASSGTAATSPSPPDPRLKPTTPHVYDNLVAGQSSLATPSLDALYSSVKPKPRLTQSPNQAPPSMPIFPPVKVVDKVHSESNNKPYSPSSSSVLEPAYSVATPTILKTKDQGTDSQDYSHVYIPGQGELLRDSTQANANGKGKTIPQKGLSQSLGKKASFDEDYEDVGDVSSSNVLPSFSHSNGLGFNHRIGKPKGPRDPPADWSRI